MVGQFSNNVHAYHVEPLVKIFMNDSASFQGNLTCPFVFLAVGRDYQGGIGIVVAFAVYDLKVIEQSCL